MASRSCGRSRHPSDDVLRQVLAAAGLQVAEHERDVTVTPQHSWVTDEELVPGVIKLTAESAQ